MGIVFRQSIKSTIAIGIGAILGALFTYICSFSLSKQELGFLTNYIYLAAVFQSVVLLGTGTLVQVYTQRYAAGDVRRKALITIGVGVTIGASVLFAILFYGLQDIIISRYQQQDRDLLIKYFPWMPLLTFIWAFTTFFELYLVSQSKIAISVFMREVLLRIFNIILIALYYYKAISYNALILGSIFAYIIPAISVFYIAAKTKGFGFTGNLKIFTRQEYREMIHFAWYHLLLIVSLNFLGYIDSLMLAPLGKEGMASLAAYRWAIFIVAIMVIPYRAITASSFVSLNQAYIDNDNPRLVDLFQRAGINLLVVGVAMFVIIASNLDNVVRILPEGYEVIKPITIIMMLGRLVDMATGLNSDVISISKHYKFNFRISIVLLITITVFNRIFIPQYGVYGAAWGTAIALILFNVLKMWFLWYKMRIVPFTGKSPLVLASAILPAMVGYYLPYIGNPITDSFTRTALIIIIYLIMLVLLKPSQDLINFLENIKKNKKLY